MSTQNDPSFITLFVYQEDSRGESPKEGYFAVLDVPFEVLRQAKDRTKHSILS
jgi:hypothetical protein